MKFFFQEKSQNWDEKFIISKSTRFDSEIYFSEVAQKREEENVNDLAILSHVYTRPDATRHAAAACAKCRLLASFIIVIAHVLVVEKDTNL